LISVSGDVTVAPWSPDPKRWWGSSEKGSFSGFRRFHIKISRTKMIHSSKPVPIERAPGADSGGYLFV
jgi:hypothetical protein